QAGIRANPTVMRRQIRVGKPQDSHAGLVYRKQVLEEGTRNVCQALLVGLPGGWHWAKFVYDGFRFRRGMAGRDTLGREPNPPQGFHFMMHKAVRTCGASAHRYHRVTVARDNFSETWGTKQLSPVKRICGLDHLVLAEVDGPIRSYAWLKDRIVDDAMCARVGPRDQACHIDPRRCRERRVVPLEPDTLLRETPKMWRCAWRHHIGAQAIQADNHKMRGLHRSSPATAWAEGAQLNGRPSLCLSWPARLTQA